jgi:hypothetical protein
MGRTRFLPPLGRIRYMFVFAPQKCGCVRKRWMEAFGVIRLRKLLLLSHSRSGPHILFARTPHRCSSTSFIYSLPVLPERRLLIYSYSAHANTSINIKLIHHHFCFSVQDGLWTFLALSCTYAFTIIIHITVLFCSCFCSFAFTSSHMHPPHHTHTHP